MKHYHLLAKKNFSFIVYYNIHATIISLHHFNQI